ncbi:hypothetical protein BDW68DRAFT_149837 [Aspergillus falconensis]
MLAGGLHAFFMNEPINPIFNLLVPTGYYYLGTPYFAGADRCSCENRKAPLVDSHH